MPFFIRPIAKGIANKVLSSYVAPNVKNNSNFIEEHLSKNEWFAGKKMTGADIQMSFVGEVGRAYNALDELPALNAWVERFQARPAYRKALELGGPYRFAA